MTKTLKAVERPGIGRLRPAAEQGAYSNGKDFPIIVLLGSQKHFVRGQTPASLLASWGIQPGFKWAKEGRGRSHGVSVPRKKAVSDPGKDKMAVASVSVLMPGSVGTNLPRPPLCPGLAGPGGPQSRGSCGFFFFFLFSWCEQSSRQ